MRIPSFNDLWNGGFKQLTFVFPFLAIGAAVNHGHGKTWAIPSFVGLLLFWWAVLQISFCADRCREGKPLRAVLVAALCLDGALFAVLGGLCWVILNVG